MRERVRQELSRPCTYGEVYLLLALDQWCSFDRAPIAPLLPGLIRRYWPGAPYHLRLDLLMAARFSGRASVDERQAICETLDELGQLEHPFLSTALVEALQALGALDDEETEHVGAVRSQLKRLLAAPDDPDMQSWAFEVWCGQFDHPLANAYGEAVSELSSEAKKRLLVMAGAGARLESTWVTVLIKELAVLDDPQALGPISRWLVPPPSSNPMPQDAIGAFAVAHIALGRLRCSLPPEGVGPFRPIDHALMACGRILYWLNRYDLPLAERRTACAEPLALLMRHELGVSVGVAYELHRGFFAEGLERLPGAEPVHASIGNAFPAEFAEICHQALVRPEIQDGYFAFKRRQDLLEFAVAGLGAWGSPLEIPTLRELSKVQSLGYAAVAAIKKLEGFVGPIGMPEPKF